MISSIVDITTYLNTNSAYTANLGGVNYCTIQVVGTPSGAITIAGSLDNVNFVAIQITNMTTGVDAATIAAAGLFQVKGYFNYLKLSGTSLVVTKVVLSFNKLQ